jgi:hypothetical protein
MRAEGLGKYADLITENSVDGATMACMDTIQDVLDLELDDLKFKPAAHARKLMKLILKWKSDGVVC